MSVYYNERDAFAAGWLRELIADGLIAPGDVDERDIQQVQADDLRGYTQCHFFAGIGGWSYAARLAGWSDDRPLWTGSCPCQPFSAAGKRKGAADERHLWPVFFDLIRQCRPDVVFGEQVESAIRMGWLDGVRADLEGEGYAIGAAVLGAHSVGAPHIRQRLYWVADSNKRDAAEISPRDAALDEQRPTHGWRPEQPTGAGTRSGDGGRADSHRTARRGDGLDAAGARLVGLADADGRIAGHGHLQPGGQHGQQPQDGGIGVRLDDAEGDRRRKDGRHVDRAPGLGEGARHAAGSGEGCGLGDANDTRSQGRIITGDSADERPAGPTGVGFWSRAEWLACSDGKARRVEPGIFPLAYGVPNRVGTLRGAGNAIVPQVAAQFIAAYLDVRAA